MRPPIEEEIEAAEVEVADSQQTAAVMLVSTRLAGNAVIRVVNRCNEAQESNNLGKQKAPSLKQCANRHFQLFEFDKSLWVPSSKGQKSFSIRSIIIITVEYTAMKYK